MLSERSQAKKKDYILYIPFIWNYRKWKSTVTWNKQNRDGGEREGKSGRNYKRTGGDGDVYYTDCCDGFMDVCICENLFCIL